MKPWPNGVASRRKMKTGVYLQLFLVRPCVDLRSLWSRSNLHASQSKFLTFGHPNQVNASWVMSINLLLANEIEASLPKYSVFVTCMYLQGRLNYRIPCHLFASHWIRIATIVVYLVLQSTPTHVNEVVMEWQGKLQLRFSRTSLNKIRPPTLLEKFTVTFLTFRLEILETETETAVCWLCFHSCIWFISDLLLNFFSQYKKWLFLSKKNIYIS